MKKFIVLFIVLLMLAGFVITSLACIPIDIKPQSCPNPLNVKKKGVLPVAILGMEYFNVTEVDPETVRLGLEGEESVSPLQWALEDVATPDDEPFEYKENCMDCTTDGPDGWLDLTLKFDAQEVIAALGEVLNGECLTLTLTGNLLEEFGGTSIKFGVDVIRIIKKGK